MNGISTRTENGNVFEARLSSTALQYSSGGSMARKRLAAVLRRHFLLYNHHKGLVHAIRRCRYGPLKHGDGESVIRSGLVDRSSGANKKGKTNDREQRREKGRWRREQEGEVELMEGDRWEQVHFKNMVRLWNKTCWGGGESGQQSRLCNASITVCTHPMRSCVSLRTPSQHDLLSHQRARSLPLLGAPLHVAHEHHRVLLVTAITVMHTATHDAALRHRCY